MLLTSTSVVFLQICKIVTMILHQLWAILVLSPISSFGLGPTDSFFNLEELEKSLYSVDISNEPLPLPQDVSLHPFQLHLQVEGSQLTE